MSSFLQLNIFHTEIEDLKSIKAILINFGLMYRDKKII